MDTDETQPMELPVDVAAVVEATMQSSSAMKRLDFEMIPTSSVKETPVLGVAPKDGKPEVVEEGPTEVVEEVTAESKKPLKAKTSKTNPASYQPSPLPEKPASMLNPRNCVPPISPEQQLQSIKNSDAKDGGGSEDEEDKKIIAKEKAKAKARAKAKAKGRAQAKTKASKPSTKPDDSKTRKRNNSKTEQKVNDVETADGQTAKAKKTKIGSTADVESMPRKPVRGKKAKTCKGKGPRKLTKIKKVVKATKLANVEEDPVGTRKRKQLANTDNANSSSASTKQKNSTKATAKEKVDKVNTEDTKAERKARYSRKSAAYHRAKKQGLKEGLDEEAALAKAKEVPWFKLIYVHMFIIFFL